MKIIQDCYWYITNRYKPNLKHFISDLFDQTSQLFICYPSVHHVPHWNAGRLLSPFYMRDGKCQHMCNRCSPQIVYIFFQIGS